MKYEEVKNRLEQLELITQQNNPSSDEFQNASAEIFAILLKDMNIREFEFMGRHMGRRMTIDDEARLVVAAAEGRPLTDAIPLSVNADVAYKIKRSRLNHGLSQQELGNLVGMTQAQIAKIENDQTNINLEMLNKIIDVLGGKMEIQFDVGA
ncbi:MAG: helix-turn-helix domain-containing protein [Lactobacillaceae bacterium]|jgi:DNA-binding XRE family transcriptional regulator|nr:helix-turn-helix domain-containing protein [Lactobacillaceae bacterium]